ncbi:hypothetical protein H0H87_007101 [Tephrocybe sp. NHM501043]|nr:hypothetical protein H0H87_007101 [Tephrocybe sp. NHM501043]
MQSDTVATLQAQIQVLTDLQGRLQTLRNVPLQLLKPSMPMVTQTLRPEFQQVKEIADTIRAEHVQDALRAGRESLARDTSDLNPNLRRESRKRRRAPSPESPQPYVVVEERTTSLFPEDDSHPLQFEGLAGYIREFNRTNKSRLHLWRRTRGDDQSTTVLRYMCPDVLTAYLTLVGRTGALVTESVATFGPRERSDFVVYRHLSQQIAQMLSLQPGVAVQGVVGLLGAYSSLFIERCSSCERVLSAEGHVPPVVRVWVDGAWTARHVGCKPVVDHPDLVATNSDTSSVVVSPRGIIHVLGYTPTEGESGTPISVRIHFNPEFSDEIYVRLVIGRKAVATTVRETHDAPYGRWQLDAMAPPLDHNTSTPKTLLSVQALDKDNVVLDTAIFGEFSYWAPGLFSPLPTHPLPLYEPLRIDGSYCASSSGHRDVPVSNSSARKPKLTIETGIRHPSCSTTTTTMSRRRGTSYITPSPTSPSRRRSASTTKTEVHLQRRTKQEAAQRAKGSKGDAPVQTPLLQLVTPLSSICENWSPAERAVGRRLVRFSKVQDGRRLVVSCEPITSEKYHEADSVISCIYREESRTCYVTSVDIIFLLERLTNNDFPVEEKNRIRRNLEGLRPTTVSKHKHGFEGFFQRIMEFPDPKPRNIEKDLKVFEWSLLDQALDKILSKYSIETSNIPADEPESPSSAEPSPSSGSEDAEYELLNNNSNNNNNNSVKMEGEPYIVEPTLSTPLQDEFTYINSSDGSASLCSPLDGAHNASYHIYNADGIHAEASSSGATHWGDYNKTVDPMGLDHYASYEVTSGNAVITYPDVDFTTPYDNSFSYHNAVEPWS